MASKDEPLREAKIVNVPSDDEIADVADDSLLMPNDGEAFEEQDEEQQEISEDKAKFSNDALVQDIMDWLDNEIALCDSVKGVMALKETRNITMVEAMNAMDLVRTIFEMKKVSFDNIRDTLSTDK